MSSESSCFRRAIGLALVVALSGCSGQTNALNLRPDLVSEISTTTAQQFPTPDTTPTPNRFASNEITTAELIATAFAQLIQKRLQCGRKPGSCPIDQLTAPDSKYRRYLAALMKFRAEANLATRAGAGIFRFRIDNINITSSFSAVVHTCIFDSLVVFDSGQSDSTRDDIVFDDDVISGHTAWQVILDGSDWKWSDAFGTDSTYGKDICEFFL